MKTRRSNEAGGLPGRGEWASQGCAAVCGDTLRDAVERLASYIVSRQSELSMRSVRRLLESDLGLCEGSLDAQPQRTRAAQAVDALLQAVARSRDDGCSDAGARGAHGSHQERAGSDGGGGGGAMLDLPATKARSRKAQRRRAARDGGPVDADAVGGAWADIPPELVQEVMRRLDDQALSQALCACSGWRAAGRCAALWEARFRALAVSAGQAAGCSSGPSACSTASDAPSRGPEAAAAAPGRAETPAAGRPNGGEEAAWRRRYLDTRRRLCRECGAACTRHTLACGRLVFPLCQGCSRGHATPTAGQRLITSSQAAYQYRLHAADLAALPYALDSNPVNVLYPAMKLFWKLQVRQAAVAKCGGRVGAFRGKLRGCAARSDD
jgi:XPA protein C-terminus